MIVYKFCTELEQAGICHRNSVKRWVRKGKLKEVYSYKNKFLGYALPEIK